MIGYNHFSYIFPPRPKNPIPPKDLKSWDNNFMVAQPKMNGSNCTVYMNENKSYVYNRHGQLLSGFSLDMSELRNLYRGKGWVVLNGEWMNKSKIDETGNVFNSKFVIFDILVKDSNHLVGLTFVDRIKILDELYKTNDSEKSYLYSISENVYRVKSFDKSFLEIFNQITIGDAVEGLVLKRKSAKLENGLTENNNTKSQIKCRVQTKNYKY